MAVKAGVIGVGYLGKLHARVYSELQECELIGVSDTDTESVKAVTDLYGCRGFSDYRELLGEVDAVSIVTPTETHFDIALEALKSGRDILLEKPITSTVGQASKLIEASEANGRVLQIGHLERFNPAVVKASELIDEPVFFESERISPFLERAAGVDVTLDLMIHDIDIMMSLAKETAITDLKVTGAKVLSERYDVAKAWIDFQGGVSALATVGRLSREKRRGLKVFQKNSFLVVDYQAMEITGHFRGPDGIERKKIEVIPCEPLKEELRDFLRCVVRRDRPRVGGQEGKRALEVALRITQIMETRG